MNARRLCMGIAALLSLSLLASCASTSSLTAVWKDQAYQGPVKRVVVLGVAKQQAIRNFFEDEFVKQLKARGVDAAASYAIIPFAQMSDRNLVAAKIKAVGADAILATRLIDRKNVETYVPGSMSTYPSYYNSWGGYYGYVYSPGYVVQDEYVFLETNLYLTSTEKLAWSARSETWVVKSDQDLMKSFIELIVDKLSSDKLIP